MNFLLLIKLIIELQKNKKIYFGIGKVKNGKGSDKKKKINLQNIKYDNELFINNIEQEFEII